MFGWFSHLGEASVSERQQFKAFEKVVLGSLQEVAQQPEPRVPRQRRVARVLDLTHSAGHHERRDLSHCEPTASVDRTYHLHRRTRNTPSTRRSQLNEPARQASSSNARRASLTNWLKCIDRNGIYIYLSHSRLGGRVTAPIRSRNSQRHSSSSQLHVLFTRSS